MSAVLLDGASRLKSLSLEAQAKLRSSFESRHIIAVVTALILLNALILGLETYPAIMVVAGSFVRAADQVILAIFVAELVLRAYAYGRQFLRDPWSLFDAAVISVAFMATNEAFAVPRAARVLRVLRLISILPRLRAVIEGLVRALPGIGAIGAILSIVFYVFAVMASKLFGEAYPHWFGNLHVSMFSLFQIMTLEGWADIVREIKQTHAYAAVFFVAYILIATFTILNLFIAVIVDAMQRPQQEDEVVQPVALERVEEELARLRQAVERLHK